ncbi:uncharacterized protein [Penaeus vannamei]|uniref:uncharacterized protein n=1 Tax=Penaeus vannamei TaxID=6689 RepID=UPI00387F86D1
MWPWSQPTCVPTSSPRRLLLNTSANCLSNNIFGSLVRYGNCLPLMASKDLFPGGDRLKPCLIDDMIEIPAKSGGSSPSCPEICDAEEFRSRVVSAPLKAGFSAWAQEGHPAHGLFGHAASARRSAAGREIDNSTLSLVTVYYPSLTYRKIIQSRPNLEMWFSSVGGHIGICLGASVISAIELLGLVFTVSLLLFRKVFQTLCSC